MIEEQKDRKILKVLAIGATIATLKSMFKKDKVDDAQELIDKLIKEGWDQVPVVYLVNTNPDLSRICDFCWAVLNYLGDHPILVGSVAYFDFRPQYHGRCYCKYLNGRVPIAVDIITDGFKEFYDKLPEKTRRILYPDKQPTKYLKSIRVAKDRTILKGLAIGAAIGKLASMLKKDKIDAARELIEKLIKRGWDDDRIIDRVLEKYPDGEGMKALKDFGYKLEV